MMNDSMNEKKDKLLAALDKGLTMVHVDARRTGVLVPEHLKNEMHLALNLSYRFDPPDLSVNEWGVRSTLRFSGTYFTVALPWSALFAITSHVTKEFWVFPNDVPPEKIQALQMVERVPSQNIAPRKPSVSLRDVSAQVPTPEMPEEAPKPGPSRGHLRLVK